MLRAVLFTFFILFSSILIYGQDTLPSISVVKKSKSKILISWINPYKKDAVKQLSIQRSYDSKKLFKTIITMPDPSTPQNGFMDTQAPNDSMYYRMYVQMDSGKYEFSKAKRPVPDTTKAVANVDDKKYEPAVTTTRPTRETPNARIIQPAPPERIIVIKKADSVVAFVPERQFKRYKDSLNYKTRDTIYLETNDTLMIRPFVPKEVFRVSKYVFTEKEGRVKISLPDATDKKYSVKFYEEDSTFLFEIKKVAEPVLMLDKSNFIHAGWFRFELYEDGHLKEKQKLYIPKDF
ncbi:hypothetical protein QEG73_16015 [Chitinophagaceae bacterium 26-R-25]|nr:hypothetical protein [Chitinophagaceae bacterium 26-R-25]